MSDTVTIYEDWDERPDGIYYKWRLEGEKTWRERKTGMKTKPYYKLHYLADEEYQLKFGVLAQATDTATPSPLESENSASQSASTTGATQSTGELDDILRQFLYNLGDDVPVDPLGIAKSRLIEWSRKEAYRLASEVISPEEDNYRLYLVASTKIPIELNQTYAKNALRARNHLRAEQRSRLQSLIQEDA